MPQSPERIRELRDEYKRLCAEAGVGSQGASWRKHMRTLRQGDRKLEPRQRPVTKQEMLAYWRARFTDREIHEIGGSLDGWLEDAA
jgi:hypothetical protein